MDDAAAHRAVVVLVPDALASARVDGFLGHEAIVVMVFVELAIDDAPAGCLLRFEAAVRVQRRLPSARELPRGYAGFETPKRPRSDQGGLPRAARTERRGLAAPPFRMLKSMPGSRAQRNRFLSRHDRQ